MLSFKKRPALNPSDEIAILESGMQPDASNHRYPMNTQTALFDNWYGDGSEGASPTTDQWQRIFEMPEDDPITLINFFKLNDVANYPTGIDVIDTNVSGEEAFNRYAAVSIPTMERVGGRFLLVGPFAGTFLGIEEDWDLIAIGQYPNLEALISLYSDEHYRGVFVHRTAACRAQKVLIATSPNNPQE